MSYNTEYKHDGVKIEIESEVKWPALSYPPLGELMRKIEELNIRVQLKKFDCKKEEQTEKRWKVEWETKDGRMWIQEIGLEDPNDPILAAEVSGEFRLSQIDAYREFRATLIKLIGEFDIKKVTMQFN